MSGQLPSKALAPLYRQFLRACEKTFKGDFEAQRILYFQMRLLLRRNSLGLSPQQLHSELQMAVEFVKYHIVQAQLNEKTGGYKAVVTDEHLKKGNVIHLNEIDPQQLQQLQQQQQQRLPWLKEPTEAKF
ncbi:hypothetical protein, conserved [Eimeria tenella]|uniref:Uncharacterized protein n=1 Tax=Eimeria tenella TaxID=5802 RepID=U6KVW2_EIMTE|nr:hypothetical protein, conserved [Eimeria tenella]CDJ39645.1 hypothetical protein, conserved [Eimeria tenella]|eukprot:XP_013230400.1 hypothetical protein, conserved [Eimeria tenella]